MMTMSVCLSVCRQHISGTTRPIFTELLRMQVSYVLAAAPRTVTDKLKRVLNAGARVITGTRKLDRGLGQILHDQLHWLDVPDRVLVKLAVTVHQCLTAAHHRICRSTASRSPVLTRAGICVPPTVTYLPYRVSGSTLTAVGRSQLLA